jgi:hypothetical protein
MDFMAAFRQQEQAAHEQNQITPGDGVAKNRHQGSRQAHDPSQGAQ